MTAEYSLEKLRAGDEAAFEALVKACEKRVYLLALRYVDNQADAMDISQDTFVKVFRNLKSFKGGSSVETWVYRIAVNTAVDFVRRAARKNEISLYQENDDGEAEMLPIADDSYSPVKSAEEAEARRALAEAIALLPEDQRKVLVMRDISDLSYAQIAQILELSEGTVKSRLFRARTRLAELLKNSGNFSSFFSSNKKEGGGR